MRKMTITTTTITTTTKVIIVPDYIPEEVLRETYEALRHNLSAKDDHDGSLSTLVVPAP